MTVSHPTVSVDADGDASPVPDVIAALVDMFPRGAALHTPQFGGNEWGYVKECLDTGWVSTAGAFVNRFEDTVARFVGADHAVATVNGTAALHTCLILAGVVAGDEVIVPSLTFVATANAVAYCGAIPHFADCGADTLCIDPDKLAEHLAAVAGTGNGACINRQTGRPLKAVVCVHALGHPADIDRLETICEAHKLALIEDAAGSLGSYYKGRHTGATARLAALSFNGNKVATTGGGGMVLTNDAALADTARHLTTTAKRPHRWEFDHDAVGYNYRLPNINAALGCAQIERMVEFLAAKRRLAERYFANLSGVSGIRMIREPSFARSNYWLNALLIDAGHAGRRDELLAELADRNIAARPAWKPLHGLPMFASSPRMDLARTEDVYRRLIDLPSGVALAPPKPDGTDHG